MSEQIFQSSEGGLGQTGKKDAQKKGRKGPRRRPAKRQTESLVFGSASRSNPAREKSHGASSKPKQSVPRHVEENRSLMAAAGVMVASFVVDGATRSLLQPPRLESRGYLLPHEVRNAHAKLQKAARASYETTVKDIPDIEEKDLVRLIKQDLEKCSDQTLAKIPLIIPIIHTL